MLGTRLFHFLMTCTYWYRLQTFFFLVYMYGRREMLIHVWCVREFPKAFGSSGRRLDSRPICLEALPTALALLDSASSVQKGHDFCLDLAIQDCYAHFTSVDFNHIARKHLGHPIQPDFDQE